MNPINFPKLITPVTATTPSHLTTTPVTTTALITSLSRRCHSPVIDPPLPSPLFVDDTDFASNIPTDSQATVEMVNATKDNFDEDDLVKFQELLLDAEKPLYEGCPDFTKLSAIVKLLNLKEPLVDDLHTLFEIGVDTYDVSTKDNFNLHVVVLWTINDYPTLGTLCGCPYSGFKGCVVCGKDINCVRLFALSKQSYVGHRRYLPYNHPFIKQKKAFNGQQEFLPAPILMTGEQIYNEQRNHIEAIDLHISKEVATTRQAYYYGVLQEIWVLDYRFRQILLFKCDWVNHKSGGVKRDKLGYTLVDLNNLGHKVDPFILGSQALQVFYVKNLVDKKLPIVFKTPPKNYKDTYDEVDAEFSIVIYHRNDNVLPLVDQRDLDNESRDDYYRKDCGVVIVPDSHLESCGSKAKLQASTKTLIVDSSDDNKGVSSKGPSITSIPKEGPSIVRLSKEPIPKELLAWYGYDIVEDDLPVAEKLISKVIFKSPIPIKRCVLGLANVETWDNTVKKFGMRTPRICADKSKGEKKACTLHLQLAYAHCICTLHLQLAFTSKHLHIAFADCICTLNFYIAFARKAFAHSTWHTTEILSARSCRNRRADYLHCDASCVRRMRSRSIAEADSVLIPNFFTVLSYVSTLASPSTHLFIGIGLLKMTFRMSFSATETPLLSSELSAMSVLVDACSLAFDPHDSTLSFDPHASTLALEDTSDACALANIHALSFSMSFQEGFTSLSLHPDFEPQNLPLSLYSSDK
ncbi:reverse transcriptase domain-containing protein [Tanacetum coccineum]